MARRFTDKQELEIIERLTNGDSMTAVAKRYGVSRQTIANVRNRHSEFSATLTHKKEENAKSILDHMDSMKDDVCNLLDTMLRFMSDEEKLSKATLSQVSTAFGILVDKFTAREQPTKNNDAKNNLLEAIAGIAKPEGLDDEV